ncbi:TRAP transporter small permease [uncultured Piscinibacter sp.]|uniref:TRAP transporter small permease n=1 Tax=uncultured Piscinibacter sp. TaxID=1131835 RepID=UPI002616087B|nr:TRAP transporter small permease [uncultured Piscinibacter sp.]
MKVLDALEEWIVTLLIGAATLVTFAAVLHRYGSGFAIPGVQDWLLRINMAWAQELTIIMFVWMAKFGAAYGVRTGIHVGVDVLINTLKPALRSKFIVFGLLAGALFTGIIAVLGAHFVWENGAHYGIYSLLGFSTEGVLSGPVTVDLEMPTWLVYSAIPLGSALMCFRFLQVCMSFIRTGQLPHHDEGHVDGIESEADEFVEFPDPSPVYPKDLHGDAGNGQGGRK